MGGQAAVCHQRVAAIKRGDPAPRYVGGKQQLLTMELLDEIREFIEEEHGRISVRTVALRFTLSRSSSRRAISMLRLCPLVMRTVLLLEERHIRDRRKFAEEVLANLALASGRQLDFDVICLRDEEIFRVDAVAPGYNSTFFGENGPMYQLDPLSGIHHAKTVGRLLRRPIFDNFS